MKRFITLLLFIIFFWLLLSTASAQDKINIKIVNQTQGIILASIDSIDHNFNTLSNITVCKAEMKTNEEFKLLPRGYNKSPYRYKLSVEVYKDYVWKIRETLVFKIEPNIKDVLIFINSKDIKITRGGR